MYSYRIFVLFTGKAGNQDRGKVIQCFQFSLFNLGCQVAGDLGRTAAHSQRNPAVQDILLEQS